MTDAFQKILKGGRKPINLQTDDGKEFYNKIFQDLMKRKGIHHFSTSGNTKASVVERFNRTLKKRLSIFYREELVELSTHVERIGLGVQSIARTTIASRWPPKK